MRERFFGSVGHPTHGSCRMVATYSSSDSVIGHFDRTKLASSTFLDEVFNRSKNNHTAYAHSVCFYLLPGCKGTTATTGKLWIWTFTYGIFVKWYWLLALLVLLTSKATRIWTSPFQMCPLVCFSTVITSTQMWKSSPPYLKTIQMCRASHWPRARCLPCHLSKRSVLKLWTWQHQVKMLMMQGWGCNDSKF